MNPAILPDPTAPRRRWRPHLSLRALMIGDLSAASPAAATRLQATCPDADVTLDMGAGPFLVAPNRLRAIAAQNAARGGTPPSPTP